MKIAIDYRVLLHTGEKKVCKTKLKQMCKTKQKQTLNLNHGVDTNMQHIMYLLRHNFYFFLSR